MKKKTWILVAGAVGLLTLVLCILIGTHVICIFHEMNPASCENAPTCKHCGHIEGEPLGHTWADATCIQASECKVCGATKGIALGHTWEKATCTMPKVCSACHEEEGDALGHAPGKTNIVRTNIIAGYYVTEQNCDRCGELIKGENKDYSTFISGESFIFTPAELMERFDSALNNIYGCYLTAGTKKNDGELAGVVWNSSGDAVWAAQFLGTGADETLIDAYERDVRGILGMCYDEEQLAYILIAMVQAADPDVSFDEAKEIAKKALNASSGSGSYEYNGIRYVITHYDGYWLAGFTIPQ